MEKEFEDLQSRMVERASIYKDTKFDPFYRFIIGEMDWNECVEMITDTMKKEV